MRGFFKSIPRIGSVKIEHVFYEYEIPTLFVCTDDAQRRYLCACCKLGEEWLVGRVSEDTLILMIEDNIALDEVFKKKSDVVFPLSWDGKHLTILPDIEQDMYPVAGALLELSEEEDSLQYKAHLRTVMLEKAALQRRIGVAATDILSRQRHVVKCTWFLNSFGPSLSTITEQIAKSAALASRIDVQQAIVRSSSLPNQLTQAITAFTLVSKIDVQHISNIVNTLSNLDMQRIAKAAAPVSQSVEYKEILSTTYNRVCEREDCQLEFIIIKSTKETAPQQNTVSADTMILLAA